MVERVIKFLITVVVICMLGWLCIWVLGEMGIMIPAMIIHGMIVLAVLIILLIAWRFFGGYLGTGW